MGMAAEISSLLRLINGGDANESLSASSVGKPTATMDLLALDSKELDLDDLQVPCGWEKRLDLKSGKIYLQRCNSSPPSEYSNNLKKNTKLQDLNIGPTASKHKSMPLNLFDDDSASLDLNLRVSLSPSGGTYQSVCTLDKVKSALERAEREGGARKRSVSTMSMSMSPSSSFLSNSSSSVKDGHLDQEERSLTSSASFAAGCPSCLMYVLVTNGNPKCPRCYCDVPPPPVAAAKRPRIDLNISI